jgi:hypothetical protein
MLTYRDNGRVALEGHAQRRGQQLHPATDDLLALLKDIADTYGVSTKPAPNVSETTGTIFGDDEIMSTAQVAAELDVTPQWARWLLRAGPLKDWAWRSEKGRGRTRLIRRRDFEEWRHSAC